RRDAIAERLAAAYGEELGERSLFRKAASQTGLCEQYAELGVILHFDDKDRLVYIELFEPAPVRYSGVPLLEPSYREVVADLRAAGCQVVEDEDGYGCEVPEGGFNLTLGNEGAVQCVGVFVSSPQQSVLGMSEEEPVPPITEHHLVSREGTSIVRLGQEHEHLRGVLGPALQSRPDYGGEIEDWFYEHGLILGFTGGRLVSLAISYAGFSGTAWFEGVQLLGRPYPEVAADLEAAGVRMET
ncbi:hypothetical protein ACFQ07_15065, partial [Actinomadura adrarensis]